MVGCLLEAGAHDQAAALLARDPAAHARLDDPGGVARLLDSLREAGAHDQAAALADRLSAAGMFGRFLEQNGAAGQFRFGREADGTPAAQWGWENLDLRLVPRLRDREATLSVGLPSDLPNLQGKSGQYRVRTSGTILRPPAQRSGPSQSSVGQDSGGCPFQRLSGGVQVFMAGDLASQV